MGGGGGGGGVVGKELSMTDSGRPVRKLDILGKS